MLTIESAVKTTLTNTELAAVAGLVKANNSTLEPGTYPVDVTIRVTGTVTKGADEVASQPQKADWPGMFALLADHVSKNVVDSVIAKAIEAYRKGEDLEYSATKRYVEDALERLGTATTTTRSGKTLVKGSVTIVG